MTFRQRLYGAGEALLFFTGMMGLTELIMFFLGRSETPPYYLAFTFIAGKLLTNVGGSRG